MTVFFGFLPIAMHRDPAAVSPSCDVLLAEFIARRYELLGDDAAIAKIMQLEDYLDRLNNRQGLGFVVNGTVLDKRKICQMMLAAGGIFTTVVPFIISVKNSQTE